LFLSGGDLAFEPIFVGDAAIETLSLQDAQLDLCHIEPGTVLVQFSREKAD
jgi:hypothetical protein